MNKTIAGVVGLALAGGVFFVPWSSKDAETGEPSARELFAVRRDDLKVTITENGTMVAKQSQKLSAKIKGEAKLLFLIEEGKEVPEGEVVCRFDATQVKSQVEQSQLDILQTEANLKTARTELEIQIVENAATLTKAKVALERAKKEIEKYRDGESPQLRRKLEVELKDTETTFNKSQKELEDCKKLLEQNYVKKSELDENQIAFDRATVQKESAQVGLLMFDKYVFPMAMTELETKLADAEREVATAEKRAESTLGQKTVNVQQVEKRLKVQNEQLKERQKDLDNMEITAPCPGIVVYGDPHEPWYRERLKIGGQVWGGQTVMTIPDLRVMQVKLQIHEADISKLKVGLKATVTTDSYPGVQLEGEVTKIATVAGGNNDWNGTSEVKKFDVEVTLKEGAEGAPKEGTAKEDTPKDATAKADTPKEGTPKDATAKADAPKEGTPKDATAKADAPQEGTPKDATAKADAPKEGTPKDATAKADAPQEGTPKDATAKADAPKEGTPKDATAKADAPKEGTPKDATAKADTPKEGTAKDATAKADAPKEGTAKDATAKADAPKEGTPKDATAKADAPKEGTPKDATAKEGAPKEGHAERMRPGISAKAEIHIETRSKTLFVPLQTVFAEDGVHYCHVHVPGNPPTKRKVQIGTSNDTYLEILDGLVEGEKVLLYNPMLPESGEAAKTAPKVDEPPPPAAGPKPGPGAPGSPAKTRA